MVPIDLLKPHPKNAEFFPDPLPDTIRQEMLEDIRKNGIATPLILARDHTILAGHQRWEIARELGFSHVPAIIRDIDPDSPEAVALLIKDNLLRRQLSDMQVARLIRVLKEQYGVRRGNNQYSQFLGGASAKVAEATGLSERTIRQLDKLNDLIPELQSLVASGKLGTTAAYELAFLSPETQKRLYEVLGEEVAALKQAEAKELRRRIEAEVRAEAERQAAELRQALARLEEEKRGAEARERELATELARLKGQGDGEDLARELEGVRAEKARLEGEVEALKRQLREFASRPPQAVEKVVYRPDPALEAELEAVREESARRGRENELLLERVRSMAAEKEKLELRVRELLSRLREAEAREEAARRQVSQKEERETGGGAERGEFLRLVRRAREAAVELSEAANALVGRYGDALRAVPAAGGADLRGTAEAVEGAASLSLLEAALRLAVARAAQVLEVMEGKKPLLKVLKGGGEEGGKEKR
ncbi:ParB/RepB/Spo0J family partition protein [Desulfovirgula thermocuniculi]|uniref:ParB/RepB/Spo0J family partition protein n=1 Tax=Desulfovirgula thermocuniculi TaxID=348842 RepID=UPI001FDF12E2|nr:ParB N-terminal domain-containing protein [Desulfovirgula thermocuniculi]